MNALSQKFLSLGLAAGLAAGGAATAATDAQAAWEPKKPVEFIIMAGKGGGADRMARLMQTVIEKNKMSSKPFTPINKSGGSGAEALIHLKNARDKDHTVMVTLNSFYTTPLRQPKIGVKPADFAPIARMAEDTFLLWVHKDSGITTFEQFLEKAKAAGNKWVMGGTGKASEDNLLTDFLNSTYGLNMKYVPYKGGGKVAKQLAGKHINSSVNNPSEALGFYEAGTVVPLVAFTNDRLPLFNSVPTVKEKGEDFAYFMQRSVVGAPGMSAEAQKYYQDLFQKVFQSEEWQTYRKKKSLQGDMLSGQSLVDYWDVQNKTHVDLLKKLGAIN